MIKNKNKQTEQKWRPKLQWADHNHPSVGLVAFCRPGKGWLHGGEGAPGGGGGGKPAPGMGFRSEAARGSEAAASSLLSFSPAGIPARPHPLAPWSPTPSFNQQRPLLASDCKLTGFGNFITALPWKLTHRFLPISVEPQTCRKADLATATQGP